MKTTATITIGQVKLLVPLVADAQEMIMLKFGATPETLAMCRALTQVRGVIATAFAATPEEIHPAGGTGKPGQP